MQRGVPDVSEVPDLPRAVDAASPGLPAQRHQSGAQNIAEHALRIESQTPA